MPIENKNQAFVSRDSNDAVLLAPHAYSAIEITNLLKVDVSQGLSNEQAREKLRRDGANALETAAGRRWWQLLFGQFTSIIIWLLAFAAVVAWFTESHLEAIAILVVLILNAAIGFAIEWQASRSLDALRKATHTFARVKRAGKQIVIDAAE